MDLSKLQQQKHDEQKGICPGCGKPILENQYVHLSHVLPQRKWLIERYGAEIIHHPLKMQLTHGNDLCNQRVQLSPNKTALVNEHVNKIRDAIESES